MAHVIFTIFIMGLAFAEYQAQSYYLTFKAKENYDKDLYLILKNQTSFFNETQRAVPRVISKETMDVITVIWYVSTFVALGAFFFLMACSDRKCGRPDPATEQADTVPLPPPTPAPSYSEFAPPSYESVVKDGIFVIQMPPSDNKPVPTFDQQFHFIDEVKKV
ncbi:hypothetical protein ACFFRR_009430 [Megaselia abdita]